MASAGVCIGTRRRKAPRALLLRASSVPHEVGLPGGAWHGIRSRSKNTGGHGTHVAVPAASLLHSRRTLALLASEAVHRACDEATAASQFRTVARLPLRRLMTKAAEVASHVLSV